MPTIKEISTGVRTFISLQVDNNYITEDFHAAVSKFTQECNTGKELKRLLTFSPFELSEKLTSFETERYNDILAIMILVDLDEMPLLINSKYRLIRDIAIFRLSNNL